MSERELLELGAAAIAAIDVVFEGNCTMNPRPFLVLGSVTKGSAHIKPQQRAFIEALLPPTVTYDQSMDLYLGSREIHVRSFPGHTGGDSVVLIPDARVVF